MQRVSTRPLINDFSRFLAIIGDNVKQRQAHVESLEALVPVLLPSLRDSGCLRQLLYSWMDMLRDGRAPARGASQSHNNGFSKISLAKLPCGWHVRLHLWPASGGDARIHDHRWSFVSFGLTGEVQARNYTRSETGEELPCFALYDADASGEKRMQRLQPERLAISSGYQVQSGAWHILHLDQPHIVSNPSQEPAATLMISAPAERLFSRSFGERGGSRLSAPPRLSDIDVLSQVMNLCERAA